MKNKKLIKIIIGLLAIPVLFNLAKVAISVVFMICSALGTVSAPATDDPIKFQDKDSCQLAFVALADTQFLPSSFASHTLECGFEDMSRADGEFDALLIAGDIAEIGDKGAYRMIWRDIDDSIFASKPVFLATGNHDIRFNYKGNTKYIVNKAEDYLKKEIDTPYYSYDVKGYTFIVMNSDAWQFEKSVISDEQLKFIDSELERGTKDGKPVFVMCHQPLTNTHGLPEVWKNGDLGEDSPEVKKLLTKYKNVFYLNGHLHDGVYENSLVVFDEDKGVYSINLPAYGPVNDYGKYLQPGLGDYIEVYEDRVVFTARDFAAGKSLEGYTKTFELK